MTRAVQNASIVAAAYAAAVESRNMAVNSADEALSTACRDIPQRVESLILLKSLNLDCQRDRPFTDDRIAEKAADGSYWGRLCEVKEATVEDLRKLRQAFGPFELDFVRKSIYRTSTDKVLIPVVFSEPGLDWLAVTVVRDLPEDSKCKIVETTATATALSIVCQL